MVKVLVVGQTPPPYGGQAISIQLMLKGNYRRLRLHHVRMVFSKEMDEIGRFKWRKMAHLVRILCSIVRSRIIHRTPILYYVPAGPDRIPMYRDFVILILARALFKKTVFQFRAAGISELYDRLTVLERWLFRAAYFEPDLAIHLSEFVPQDGIKLIAKQMLVVPNGLEDRYDLFPLPECKIGGMRNLLYVGVLRESKGVTVLLEACLRVVKKGHRFRLTLMGMFESTRFRQIVENFIRENGLESIVHCIGVKTGGEKWRAYRDADIVVFPSFFESEAMPRVVLEAMHLKIPVIATRWRGIPSMVEDGVSGFLVPVRDSRALADRIGHLLSDAYLRQQMGECGRKIYLERFTAERFWRNMENAFLVFGGL